MGALAIQSSQAVRVRTRRPGAVPSPLPPSQPVGRSSRRIRVHAEVASEVEGRPRLNAHERMYLALLTHRSRALALSVDQEGWTAVAIREADTMAQGMLEVFGTGSLLIFHGKPWTRPPLP